MKAITLLISLAVNLSVLRGQIITPNFVETNFYANIKFTNSDLKLLEYYVSPCLLIEISYFSNKNPIGAAYASTNHTLTYAYNIIKTEFKGKEYHIIAEMSNDMFGKYEFVFSDKEIKKSYIDGQGYTFANNRWIFYSPSYMVLQYRRINSD